MRTIKATKLNEGFGAEYVDAWLAIHRLDNSGPVEAPVMTPEEEAKFYKGFGAEYVDAWLAIHRLDNK